MVQVAKTVVNGVELTEQQLVIIAMIESAYAQTGTGVGFDDICKAFGYKSKNALNTHVERILKSGKIVCEVQNEQTGKLRANSLRPANSAVVKSDLCRTGSNFSVIVVGAEVAFTVFSEAGIVRHDRLPIEQVLTLCEKMRIPADLSVIDRVAKLAAKMADKMTAAAAV